jgi:hypothetical protein
MHQLAWIKRQPLSNDLFQSLVQVNFYIFRSPDGKSDRPKGSEGTQDALGDILACALETSSPRLVPSVSRAFRPFFFPI